MTRSSSPNGKVEFSYDFPIARASTSQLAPTKPKRRQRTRSPTRAQTNYYLSDDDDDLNENVHIVYPDSEPSFPHTGNQWATVQRPPSPMYPYGAFYDYTTSHNNVHQVPLLLTPPRSCDSACSMLSACSSQRGTKKIRKQQPRRSVDSDRDAPVPAPLSVPTLLSPTYSSTSSTSSPYTNSPRTPNSFLDDSDELESHHSGEYTFSPEYEEPEGVYGVDGEEGVEEGQEEPRGRAPSAFRKQWAALSLKVSFGVFRAKRRMRARVMSL